MRDENRVIHIFKFSLFEANMHNAFMLRVTIYKIGVLIYKTGVTLL